MIHFKGNNWIVCLDLEGDNLSHWKWPKNTRLLIGEEGLGLPEGKFQQMVTIPQSREINSLNGAVATSIALFTYRQQFPLS